MEEGCKLKSEVAIRSDVLYSIGQGNLIVIRENSGNVATMINLVLCFVQALLSLVL